ncbi:hypothetical protein ACN27F_10090 [Solwaraspora sp. WMMB335]|uniref:hypothetical protein n=1 Tax=Solwaraspora sp. WMMB335 TaxID=3404118 RepID=UPI003B941329
MIVDHNAMGEYMDVDRGERRRGRVVARRRVVGVVVVVGAGMAVASVLLVVVALLVRVFADGLSLGVRVVLVLVGTVVGTGLVGWWLQPVLGPAVERLVRVRDER